MSIVERILTTTFYLYWTWRVGTFLYSSYSVSETVTPSSAGTKVKISLMLSLVVASMILHILPLNEFPHFSLMNTLVSIPSQIHTIIFLYRYVVPTVKSTRFTVFVHIMTMLSVIETTYLIYVDWDKIYFEKHDKD